ncbi:MAG: leucyl aminopeptidase [Patescibacteria group bacterium]
MEIRGQYGKPHSFSADALVVFGFNGKKPNRTIAVLDRALGGKFLKFLKDEGWKGEAGESIAFPTLGKIPAKKVIIVGLGKEGELSLEDIRRAVGGTMKFFHGSTVREVAVSFCEAKGASATECAQAMAEGAVLASYQYVKYKAAEAQKHAEKGIKKLTIVLPDSRIVRPVEAGIARALLLARAAVYARDLVNEPASICTPNHLAEHAQKLAEANPKRIRVEIFDRAEAKRRGMGAFLAVAQGAAEEPYFIHLTYRPVVARRKKIALVGKGITFDSGGLQIKPDSAMQTMKLDMSGAAAVLGVFSVLPELAPPHEVRGIIASTENMPGGKAYKPGDIVRAMNGKTIEIGHTDAEGRVTLADSLSFAAKLRPDMIIDLATLTGACMVALGEEIGGLMSNNRKLAEKVLAAGEQAGEKFWELPLVPEYKKLVQSHVADLRNSSSTRYGGAITAGLFLEEFVAGIPWAHLDIAGPAYAEREMAPYIPLGGTGFGTRTIIELLRNL